jgi:tripartite-type tricarboxylate transporter receptor subunit TctC
MKCSCCLAIVAACLTAFPPAAAAQGYPARPIRLIVPFAPSGNVDITARTISGPLGESLGQQVIVENRPGASGQIGADAVLKAPPDGHTLMMASSSVMTNAPAVLPKISYDIQRDFAPVGRVSIVPLVIVVHPTVPARTTRQLIALAKARPGDIRMASGGTGSTSHLIAELFAISAEVSLNIIPYKGGGQALTDLLGGHVDARIDQIPSSIGHIRDNRLRAIAVTTAARAAALPDLPTLAESGLKGFEASTVTGVLAPAAVPKDIIAKLNGALVKILAMPAVKERFDSLGAAASPSTPEELAAFIREDLAKWVTVVKRAGIKVQ